MSDQEVEGQVQEAQQPVEATESHDIERHEDNVEENVEESVEDAAGDDQEHQDEADEDAEDDGEQGDDDEALSDLDEEEYREERRPVDEEVYKLKTQRRARKDKAEVAPKEKRRQRNPRKAAAAEVEDEEEFDEPEVEVDEATRARRELEAKIDAALKPSGKRRKIDGDDLEQMMDEKIAKLRDAMRKAALDDIESVRNNEPAIHKVKMLPEVVDVLSKHNLADSILDGNLLESVRIWLEPLPDASLPSYEIQRELFRALEQLPIKTIHLRESGLGRVVLFYKQSKRPHGHVKRIAERLIGDWTRPIMGRSDNYRDKQVRTASYDPEDAPAKANRSDSRTLAEESALRRNRAAIPTARGDTYSIAPMSAVSGAMSARAAPPADSQLRRMKTKLLNATRQQKTRKSNVSIEGRNLH